MTLMLSIKGSIMRVIRRRFRVFGGSKLCEGSWGLN